MLIDAEVIVLTHMLPLTHMACELKSNAFLWGYPIVLEQREMYTYTYAYMYVYM